jgi:integrase
MTDEMARGDGQVFQRGARWYIAYYGPAEDGRWTKIREVAGSTEKAAQKLLKERLFAVEVHKRGKEKFIQPSTARILLADLLDDVVNYYERCGLKSTRELKNHQKRVRAELGKKRAVAITSKVVEDYISMRQKEHAAPATVDRETETIQRAFSLARKRGTMLFAPNVPKTLQKDANARQGFLERADFDAILAGIEDADLKDALEWMAATGMRHREFCSLTWDAYDGKALRLPAKDAKTGVGRVIPIVGPLSAIMERREARKTVSPLIFHSRGRTMAAKSGGFQFRLWKLWRTACKDAGLEQAITYDLRRVAVRNLVGAGVSMKVAMSITGHTTTSTFFRYQIVPTDDVAEALKLAAAYVQTQPKDRKVLRFAKKNGPKNGPTASPTSTKGR